MIYRTDNDDTLVIKNYTHTTQDSTNLPNSIPAEDTDLAAYTVGRASYVIYQSKDKSLNEYNVDRRNSMSHDSLFRFKANAIQQPESRLSLVLERALHLPPPMTTRLGDPMHTMWERIGTNFFDSLRPKLAPTGDLHSLSMLLP